MSVLVGEGGRPLSWKRVTRDTWWQRRGTSLLFTVRVQSLSGPPLDGCFSRCYDKYEWNLSSNYISPEPKCPLCLASIAVSSKPSFSYLLPCSQYWFTHPSLSCIFFTFQVFGPPFYQNQQQGERQKVRKKTPLNSWLSLPAVFESHIWIIKVWNLHIQPIFLPFSLFLIDVELCALLPYYGDGAPGGCTICCQLNKIKKIKLIFVSPSKYLALACRQKWKWYVVL